MTDTATVPDPQSPSTASSVPDPAEDSSAGTGPRAPRTGRGRAALDRWVADVAAHARPYLVVWWDGS